MKRVDFFGRREHYLDHMMPVWDQLDPAVRGIFWIPECLVDYADEIGLEGYGPLEPINPVDAISVIPLGAVDPLVVSAYHDLLVAYKHTPGRSYIMMEHGVGLTFGPDNPGYAGGRGNRTIVDLFLAPNEYIRRKTESAIPGVKQVVIGTPKMDPVWRGPWDQHGDKPTVCISFHWNGRDVAPEAGNAWDHYEGILQQLAQDERFHLIGHGHPRAFDYFSHLYKMEYGIEPVRSFAEVMERADIYVNDASSTLYEFCVTGKPVIILNAPWFRRDVQHGIRFWDYTDIGYQVDDPDDLAETIVAALAFPEHHRDQREKMVRDLYPHLGRSSRRAAAAIEEFIS